MQTLDNHKRVAALNVIERRLQAMIEKHRHSSAEDNPYNGLLQACVITNKLRTAIWSDKPPLLV